MQFCDLKMQFMRLNHAGSSVIQTCNPSKQKITLI